jgi:uncharacterized integral membrane protein
MNSPNPDVDGIEETAEWNWKMIAAGVVAVLVMIFILQNTEKRSIQFLFFDWTVGTWVALLVTFVLGMLVGWLLAWFIRSRKERVPEQK